jgi:hypothetical protein
MAIVIAQTVTGSATAGTSFLTTTSWTPLANELILVAVATRNDLQVTGVTGNGITFTLVLDQRQTLQTAQTRLSLWRGMSASPIAGQLLIQCGATILAAVAHAHRISGADATGVNGAGAIEAVNGAETGALDTNAPGVLVTTLSANARAYAAFSHRTQVFTVGAGETAILLNTSIGNSGNVTKLSTEYQDVASPATVTLNGTLAAAIDWLAIGVSIKPASTTTPQIGSDSGALADARTLALDSARVDSVTASEGVSVTSAAVGTGDASSLTDVSLLSVQRAVAAIDGLLAADVAGLTTGPGDQTVVAADASTLTESPSVIAEALSRTDSAALADAALVTVPLAAVDSLTASEGAVALARASSSTDGLALSDSSALVSNNFLSANDSASSSDVSLLNTNTLTIASSDLLTLSELATTGLKAATDSAVLADSSSVNSSINVAKTGSDSAALTDSSAVTSIVLAASDVVTLAEGRSLSWASLVTDSAAVGEARALGATLTPVTDSAALSEGRAIFLSASDVATVVEMPLSRETEESYAQPSGIVRISTLTVLAPGLTVEVVEPGVTATAIASPEVDVSIGGIQQ